MQATARMHMHNAPALLCITSQPHKRNFQHAIAISLSTAPNSSPEEIIIRMLFGRSMASKNSYRATYIGLQGLDE
jgi:hypothetical protein